ncbi:MAG: biotin/lipoyl-containing protein [Terriglobia bacterium]
MKMEVKIHSATLSRQHIVEFARRPDASDGAGRLAFTMDGEPGELDWAEVEPGVYSLILAGRSFEVRLRRPGGSPASRTAQSGSKLPHSKAQRSGVYQVSTRAVNLHIEVRDQHSSAAAARLPLDGPHEITAPMPGRIVKLLAEEGQRVEAGEGILVIEAMKMQNEVRAPRPGLMERVYVREGDGVEAGAKLARLV